MLHICTFVWGNKYHPAYLARLYAGVNRHLSWSLKESYRFIAITDDCWKYDKLADEVWSIRDIDLLRYQGCFARLRLFDPEWQMIHGIREGERIVCVDLDSIVTGNLDALFTRPNEFSILTGANSANPCPYNGSIWMLRAGYRPDVWSDFSLDAAAKVPYYEFPDDQGWLHHKIPDCVGWKAGKESGVYAFQKPGWPKGTDALPDDARLVVFPGSRDPSKFTHLDWVQKHWQV